MVKELREQLNKKNKLLYRKEKRLDEWRRLIIYRMMDISNSSVSGVGLRNKEKVIRLYNEVQLLKSDIKHLERVIGWQEGWDII